MTASTDPPALFRAPFVGTSVALLLTVTTFGMALPVLPRLISGPLAGGDSAVGWVAGVFALASVGARPFVATAAGRRGTGTLVLLGCVACSVGLLAHAAAPGVSGLGAARFIAGAGYGVAIVGLMAGGVEVAPPARRGEATMYLMVGTQLGMGLGPVLGEALLATLGYTAVWLVAGGLAAGSGALGVVAAPSARYPVVEVAAEGRAGWFDVVAVGPGGMMALAVGAFAAFVTFVPLHADRLGMNEVASVLLLSSAVVIVVRVLSARTLDHASAGGLIRAGLILEVAGFLLLALWARPLGVYASVVVMSIGWAVIPPTLMHVALQRAGDERRLSVVITFTMLLDCGMAAGPLLAGFVAAAAGYQAVFVLAAAMAGTALAWHLTADRRRARPAHEVTPVVQNPIEPSRHSRHGG